MNQRKPQAKVFAECVARLEKLNADGIKYHFVNQPALSEFVLQVEGFYYKRAKAVLPELFKKRAAPDGETVYFQYG